MLGKIALYLLVAAMMTVVLFSTMTQVAFAAASTVDPCDPTAATGGKIALCNPLGTGSSIPSVLKKVFNEIAFTLALIVPIIIIIGAFQMMFAAGDPEKFATGRKTIVYAVIGFVIVLMANGIIAIVSKILTPTT